MAQVTVNKLLAMEKSLRERLGQLNELKNNSSREFHWMKEEKTEKPTYDIKAVDAMIVKINKALFDINHTIKESNAKTLVDVSLNYDELVAPIA
jgi:RNA processing factor Prp31